MQSELTPVAALRIAYLKKTPNPSGRDDGLTLEDKPTSYTRAGYQKPLLASSLVFESPPRYPL